ncbi:MAG: addiction module protein [Alphaproteobacteria bacterium]|nr:addiction module protein [Alphaproteobacteria bacterium]
MSKSSTVLAEALSLDSTERVRIALRLVESVEEPTPEDIDAAWAPELARRAEEVRSGRAVTVPADDVLTELEGWLSNRSR